MPVFKPYICTHLDLASHTSPPEPVTQEDGQYIVLWWNARAIGHLFIKPGEVLTPSAYEAKILHAASWAMQHYTGTTATSWTVFRSIFSQAFSVSEKIPLTCRATVVICTRDRAQNLHRCLTGLTQQVCKPSEIIVIDNASRHDDTRKTVEAFSNVKYIREDNPGLDIARNTGAREASEPIILYTDDDTDIHPQWVYESVKTFDDPAVMAFTGLVLAAELNTEAQYIFERHWPFNRGFIAKRYDTVFFNDTVTQGVPVWTIGAGANMGFRKSIFSSVGYFDERLDVGAAGCNGDSEMWYRILAAGYTIQYNPRAIVSHYHRDTMDKFKQQIFFYMRGFTAAIMIQHQRFRHKGNLRHLYRTLPPYYSWLLLRGFPYNRGRYKTIFAEIHGIFSGLIFYLKYRNTPSNHSR
ncbi:MAG TPA: glycosyltransferase [Ohtaekwangia sp.]|uniref:glycosyltransferase family 2 protein n=1 Tax=Ohtaekwangia sp. TaxID=2066019 RepID=UPI002F91E987